MKHFRQRSPFFNVWSLLDKETDAKLMREFVVQRVDQLFSEQRLLSAVSLAPVQAVDEIERRHVGIAADHEVPAFIADIDTEGAPFGAERSIAQIPDTRRDQRAAIGIDRGRGQTPGDVIGMVHQVPPHHVAAVGDAIGGPATVSRHQQQPWSFDTISRDDVYLGLHAPAGLRSGVLYEIYLTDASVFTNDDTAADRPIQDPHKSGARSVI